MPRTGLAFCDVSFTCSALYADRPMGKSIWFAPTFGLIPGKAAPVSGVRPETGARIQSITSIVINCRARINRAVDRSDVSARSAPKSIVRCGDGAQRSVLIEVAGIAYVVRVVTKEAMQANVTNIIHGQHRAWPQFSLHANVELHGIRRAVARRQKLGSGVVERIRQNVADKPGVALGSCRQRRLLQCRFDSECIGCHAPDWLAAHLRGDVLAVDRRLQRPIGQGNPALTADFLDAKENTFLQSRRTVEENVVPDCILVVDPEARSDHRLSALPGIP